MVRIIGFNRNRKRGRKRLAPSARSPDARREHFPMYQYALNEYAQTVAAGTSNDEGKLSAESSSWSGYDEPDTATAGMGIQTALSAGLFAPSSIQTSRSGPYVVESVLSHASDDSLKAQPSVSPLNFPRNNSFPMKSEAGSDLSTSKLPPLFLHPLRSHFEAEMPDATYEETYGDAYTGGPIKYVYPSGYQSMRPRSCPWKLSIVVFLLFTWLSVFIVGHCSDQVDQTKYHSDEFDDDVVQGAVVLDTRWCGSRPLYLMWVTSMLITGLAAAYCSVIGYIKVRDFAVGNMRSQPPGVVVSGKSDYYVRIEDGVVLHSPPSDVSSSSKSYYRPSIYQSDGTPQFWGAHIYRPTQAAVAITSR